MCTFRKSLSRKRFQRRGRCIPHGTWTLRKCTLLPTHVAISPLAIYRSTSALHAANLPGQPRLTPGCRLASIAPPPWPGLTRMNVHLPQALVPQAFPVAQSLHAAWYLDSTKLHTATNARGESTVSRLPVRAANPARRSPGNHTTPRQRIAS